MGVTSNDVAERQATIPSALRIMTTLSGASRENRQAEPSWLLDGGVYSEAVSDEAPPVDVASTYASGIPRWMATPRAPPRGHFNARAPRTAVHACGLLQGQSAVLPDSCQTALAMLFTVLQRRRVPLNIVVLLHLETKCFIISHVFHDPVAGVYLARSLFWQCCAWPDWLHLTLVEALHDRPSSSIQPSGATVVPRS